MDKISGLEELLAGVTPELIGVELDWGMDVGVERQHYLKNFSNSLSWSYPESKRC